MPSRLVTTKQKTPAVDFRLGPALELLNMTTSTKQTYPDGPTLASADVTDPRRDDRKIVTHTEWIDEARNLFGRDVNEWIFICPACKTPQTVAELRATGIEDKFIGSSCIGRHHPNGFRFQGLGHIEVDPDGVGCDYTAYGLMNLCPVEVRSEDRRLAAFAFGRVPSDGVPAQIGGAQ